MGFANNILTETYNSFSLFIRKRVERSGNQIRAGMDL